MSKFFLESESFTATTTSQMIYDVNGSRIHFSINNQGSNNVYVSFGENDATSSTGILVKPDEFLQIFCPGRGQIHCISVVGPSNCVITQG